MTLGSKANAGLSRRKFLLARMRMQGELPPVCGANDVRSPEVMVGYGK